jgi:hypothetical protein
MKILDRIEDLIENLLEGVFRRNNPSPIQPIEIGRKLLKVMEGNKRVSIAKTYVPNQYQIYLNPNQLIEFESLKQTLAQELKGVLQQKAEKENLSFIGNLWIDFTADPDLDLGAIRIEAGFLEQSESETGEFSVTAPQADFGHTQIFSIPDKIKKQAHLVIENHEHEYVHSLSGGRQSLGRSHKCDIVIKDQNVSRVHAWLESVDGQWKLIDNESTNGTFVNNQRIGEQVLQSGDQIRVGTTTIIFQDGE